MAHKKAAGTAVDKRNGQKVPMNSHNGKPVPVTGGSIICERYEPPEDVCEMAAQAWDDFWEDGPSKILTPSGRIVLDRWINAKDRYYKALEVADKAPMQETQSGSLVRNPMYSVAMAMEKVIVSCEKQLGIGAYNASSLGMVALAEANSGFVNYNAAYEDEGDDDDVDPRITVIPGRVDS